MGLTTTDVDLVVGDHCDVHSAQHHDWMLGLFAVQTFGKSTPIKNTRFAFSQRDLFAFCVKLLMPNQRNIYLCVLLMKKETHHVFVV